MADTVNTAEYILRINTDKIASDLKRVDQQIAKGINKIVDDTSKTAGKSIKSVGVVATAITASVANMITSTFSRVKNGVSNATGDELVEFAFCKRLFLTWSGLFIMFSPSYSLKLIAQISCSGRIAVICNNKLFFEIDFTIIIIFPSVAIIFWAEGFAPFIKFLSII